MRLPIGYDTFPAIKRHRLDFVDKSLFIQEILDNVAVQAAVILRPRRFGKTLNLSMLQCFLAAEVDNEPTKDLFQGLKIAGLGEEYRQHQGKYPVISITFKDINSGNFASAYAALEKLLSEVYGKHRYLLSSPHLTSEEREAFGSVLRKEADSSAVKTSLYDLTYYLDKHFGVKPWLLIDEYDTPIEAGYLCGYYDDIIQLLHVLFGSAIKGNASLERAVLTGTLWASKQSLFSGLNNVLVYSMFESAYSRHFGFTEEEAEHLLKQAGLEDQSISIRQWYNGYQIGGTMIYNPWSLVNCIQQKGLLQLYWVKTSSDDLIRDLLTRGDEQVKMNLASIIHGKSITALIDKSMIFGDLEEDRNALWSLLLFSGYFKIIHTKLEGVQLLCELMAPNCEVVSLYRGIIRDWLEQPKSVAGALVDERV